MSTHRGCYANLRLPAEVDASTREPLLRSERKPWAVGGETHLAFLLQPCALAFECAIRHRTASDSFQQAACFHDAFL